MELQTLSLCLFWLICGVRVNGQLVSINKCLTDMDNMESVQVLNIPPHMSYTKDAILFRLGSSHTLNTNWCGSLDLNDVTIEMEEIVADAEPEEEFNYITVTNSTSNNASVTEEYDDYVLPSIKKYFLNNGWLRIGSEYYRPNEYCVKGINSTSKIINVTLCQPNCTAKETPCINKCCSIGTNLNIFGQNCSATGSVEWKPFLYKDVYNPVDPKDLEIMRPHLVQQGPSCSGLLEQWPLRRFNMENVHNDVTPWRILKDGTVWYMRNRRWVKLNKDNYCIDGILNYGDSEFYTGDEVDQALLICGNDVVASEPDMTISSLYAILMYISAIFLFITAIVYFLLWEHQNVHGWTVLSQVVTMFFMYVFIASSRIYSMNITHEEIAWPCWMFGITSHFFYLLTFAWLTMVNYDLSWTFRSLSPGSGRSKGAKRYMLYFFVAISVPVSIITVGIVLESLYGDDEWSEVLTPGYGKTHCFIAYWAQGVYMYYIIGFLLTCNFILIGITIITIYRFQRSTRLATRSCSSNSQTQLELFIKLFVVMGVTWIFEIISWFLSAQDSTPWYFVIFDVVNILQAVAIFVIFVCKRRTLRQLGDKYPVVQRFTDVFTKSSNANDPRTTGSSVHNSTTVGYNSNRIRLDSNPNVTESKM